MSKKLTQLRELTYSWTPLFSFLGVFAEPETKFLLDVLLHIRDEEFRIKFPQATHYILFIKD
ncbi:hypothetical protein [Anabaena sp. CCY 9402-a]|uniref:hypothetical protein n=1 Tax=Anabaena sp. CCY 9402-a TaxID=3103867 RepID=UPI0039C69CB1